MATDPICGMTVDPATAAGRFEYEGQAYYFCASSCLDRFRADPEKALKKAQAPPITIAISPTARKPLPMMMPAAPAAAGVLDPVCGMTVQPETATGSHMPLNYQQFKDLVKRLLSGTAAHRGGFSIV